MFQTSIPCLLNHVFRATAAWIKDGDEGLRTLSHLVVADGTSFTSKVLPVGRMPLHGDAMFCRVLLAKGINTAHSRL